MWNLLSHNNGSCLGESMISLSEYCTERHESRTECLESRTECLESRAECLESRAECPESLCNFSVADFTGRFLQSL